MLAVDVPAGVTVNGIVVGMDVQFDWQKPVMTGAITLRSPDATTVTLANSFAYGSAVNGLTRIIYPSLAQPPPPDQPDLSPFKGKSGSGTWTLTIAAAADIQVADLALYIVP
jgi:hypothetical protein